MNLLLVKLYGNSEFKINLYVYKKLSDLVHRGPQVPRTLVQSGILSSFVSLGCSLLKMLRDAFGYE